MRKRFYSSIQKRLEQDERIAVLLGDIGVFSFSESMKKFPERVLNFGIMEQTMIGSACGLAKSGVIPFVHSIAPFVTERCYEQLKLNFGYENVNAFVISVGNSYDYAGLGCTHHCTNDLRIISSIPNFKTFCAGNPSDVDSIIEANINTEGPKYIRLSEFSNNLDQLDGDDLPDCNSNNGVCLIVGNGIKDFKKLKEANIDCNFSYTTKVSDFEVGKFGINFLLNDCKKNITVVEPCYDCGILAKIALGISGIKSLYSISVPKEFIEIYGTKHQIDQTLGLDDDSIIQRLLQIYGSRN